MSFLVFDVETNAMVEWGLPADHDNQARLAAWGMLFVDDNMNITEGYHGLVKPDGWCMTEEASRVNGLTDERLHAEGKDIRLPMTLMGEAIDFGRTLVAHNLSFDLKIMRGEFRRLDWGRDDRFDSKGVPLEPYKYADRCERSGICTMLRLTAECQIPRNDGKRGYKWPKLQEAVQIILGEELRDAHTAAADTIACYRLLKAMKQRGLLRSFGAAA